jgi:hypothetical protein
MYIIGGAILALALGGVLVWTRLAPAQPPAPKANPTAETMRVTVQEVEVRSGPSLEFYPTSKLKYGDSVEVLGKSEKNPGWLAIKPPPGSQSWINANFVQMQDKHIGVVTSPDEIDIPVKPASTVSSQEPNVEIAKVQHGTQVVVIGEPKRNSGGSKASKGIWLPIEPTPGEVRYIPESAVARGGLQPASATGQGNGFVAPPGSDQSAMADADAALLKAKQLYEKAALSLDPTQRAQAQSRLQSLNQMMGGSTAAQQPGYPYSTASQQGGTAVKVSLGTNIAGQGATGTTASYSTTAPQPAAGGARWSVWGKLQRTAYKQDGLPMYKIVDDRGETKEWAVAANGLTLEPYVGQVITVYGTPTYRSDDYLRVNYTIVTHLSQAPSR